MTGAMVGGAAAAPVAHLVRRGLAPWAARHPHTWTRVNHRGDTITLLEGPSVAAGLVAGMVLGGAATGWDRRTTVGSLVAVVGAAGFGLYDDLSEDARRNRKGLRGHLGALARGELTTGGLKVLGISSSALVAAACLLPRAPGQGKSAWAVEVLEAGALVAGAANLVNLLDLRPGRALKVGALTAACLTTRGRAAPVAGTVLGAAAAAAPGDLGERDMLGDCGANALGAAVGVGALVGLSRPLRAAALAAVLALTFASERVSFTAVIERTPVLRAIDMWGRR